MISLCQLTAAARTLAIGLSLTCAALRQARYRAKRAADGNNSFPPQLREPTHRRVANGCCFKQRQLPRSLHVHTTAMRWLAQRSISLFADARFSDGSVQGRERRESPPEAHDDPEWRDYGRVTWILDYGLPPPDKPGSLNRRRYPPDATRPKTGDSRRLVRHTPANNVTDRDQIPRAKGWYSPNCDASQ